MENKNGTIRSITGNEYVLIKLYFDKRREGTRPGKRGACKEGKMDEKKERIIHLWKRRKKRKERKEMKKKQ